MPPKGGFPLESKMLFKNISNEIISAYGYTFGIDGKAVDVKEPPLIRKFGLYDTLESADIITEPKAGEVSRETLKSQAIAAGLKVDGRWSDTRLRKEIDEYMREANGN